MLFFVKPGSIVRQIWGDADVILLVFAGSSAEFALNRAVDWLFFTGKLPADPIARLFSTVRYAQEIVFLPDDKARQTIARMGSIHVGVEQKRGYQIPDWAYRDVLYMLIDYSERAYETLYRPLTNPERDELFSTFREVGAGMHVSDLPDTYADWRLDRQTHLNRDLVRSSFTDKLFQRYREQLGNWRYGLLRQAQAVLVPKQVSRLLALPQKPLLSYSIGLYKVLNAIGLRSMLQRILLPTEYLGQIRSLDNREVPSPTGR
ncbi:oxygenase MpaB family protein [Spirosoma areae]